ncbi:NAD(P)H-hydrate epimerase [Alkalibacterium sp. MB6]|uniref:NAD(P)H-hydrate epimerase n=1 Tax=Alkalibacterium sp. MB6 TaxID=2081965 RepID=UPI00137B48C4|nr:NAD(P)H-hydrate epimerase [Alkalibacterium sp. MB6]
MSLSVSAKEMKAIDECTIHTIGIPSLVLMERAALGIVEALLSDMTFKQPIILCGPGNNGGDGLAIGRILYLMGYEVTLCLIGPPDKWTDQTQVQHQIATNLKLSVLDDVPDNMNEGYDIVIDALFGIGLDREVESPFKEVIERINQFKGPVVSVDIPSGLSADTGRRFNTAVIANRTYTIGFNKQGFEQLSAKALTGKVTIIDIGYPPEKMIKHFLESREKNE